jgi:recombinational DNA repair protein RecT
MKGGYRESVGQLQPYQIKHDRKVILEHSQDPDNIDLTKIKGAYATILYKDGSERSDYMTLEQIRNSWQRSQTRGSSDVHKLAPDEMCKRTVIRRLIKPVINATDDAMLMDQVAAINHEADENQNAIPIDITPESFYIAGPASDFDSEPIKRSSVQIETYIEPIETILPPLSAAKPVQARYQTPVATPDIVPVAGLDDQITLPWPE